MLRTELVEGFSSISALKREWDELYLFDPESPFFLSHNWLFGTFDGAGKYSFLVTVRTSTDDRLVAALPIRINTEFEDGKFHNELNLSGNYNSDYNGFLCAPEFEEAAIPLLSRKLKEVRWRRLRLLNFCASEARANHFLEAFRHSDFDIRPLSLKGADDTNNAICPYAPLAADWDTYLTSSVSPNTRQKIRRYLRKVEQSDEYTITHTTAETMDRDIEILIKLWTDRWGSIKGKRIGAIQTSFRRMLRSACETECLFMPILWHSDQPVCIHAIFVDRAKKSYNFYVGARDMAFGKLPSGLVLHGYAIRLAIDEGIETYDFLRGDEPYKYAFGAQEKHIRSVLISTTSGQNTGGQLDPRCMGYMTRRSKELYRLEQYQNAGQAWNQIWHADPKRTGARYMATIAQRKADGVAASIEDLASLVKDNPGSLKLWMRLGRALAAKYDNWNDVVGLYAYLLKSVPDQRNVPLTLGAVLCRLGQTDFGLAILESGLRRDPGNKALGEAILSIKGIRRSPEKRESLKQRNAGIHHHNQPATESPSHLIK